MGKENVRKSEKGSGNSAGREIVTGRVHPGEGSGESTRVRAGMGQERPAILQGAPGSHLSGKQEELVSNLQRRVVLPGTYLGEAATIFPRRSGGTGKEVASAGNEAKSKISGTTEGSADNVQRYLDERWPKESFREFFSRQRGNFLSWAQYETNRVSIGEPAWPKYNSGARVYQREFRCVLPEGFTKFLDRRRGRKGQVFVLDVMGTGGFFPDFLVEGDHEVSITLIDHRSQVQKDEDARVGKTVIAGQTIEDQAGNILRNTPWLRAEQFIRDHDHSDFPGFDLINCFGISGWEALLGIVPPRNKYTRLITRNILQREYALLSPVGGTMLVDVPDVGLSRWVRNLQTMTGLNVKYEEEDRLRITKKKNAPLILPKVYQ